MWSPLHVIQKVHKVNENITSVRYGYFPEHVTIQKWDIKQTQTSSNNPRVPKSRLQQVKNKIRVICTGLHRYHTHHQAKNSRNYCTDTRKWTGQTWSNVARDQKTAPHIHMDKATNQWIGNAEGGWNYYEGKTDRYDIGIPYFWLESRNYNHGPSRQWTRKRVRIISQKWVKWWYDRILRGRKIHRIVTIWLLIRWA